VTGSVEVDADPCFEGFGLGAMCGNRGRRTRLQWRLGRLRSGFLPAASPLCPHLVGVAAGVWRAAQARVRQ
jgi:hypothetical protein